MHCTKCGKENDDDAIFCKHCGINMETGVAPDTQVPEEPLEKEGEPELEGPARGRRLSRSRQALRIFFIAMIVILISFTVIYIVLYENVDEHKFYTYDPATTPDSLTIDLEMRAGGVEIEFTSDLDAPVVHIDHHIKWSGAIIKKPSFDASASKVSFFGGSIMGESESEVTITLRSDVKYNIDTKIEDGALNLQSDISGTSFGSISLDVRNGASNIVIHNATISAKVKLEVENGASNLMLTDCTLSNIEATSESGSSNMVLTNCTMGGLETTAESGSSNVVLTGCTIGNIKATVDSGSLNINARDINVSSDITWTCKVDEGGVNLDIVQSIPLGADVTVDVDVDDRDIEVNFRGNTTFVRAKFSCHASKDLSLFNGAGFKSPAAGTMESMNYDDTALGQFQFILDTSNGDIVVEAVNP